MGTDELLAWPRDARKHADYSLITRGASSRFCWVVTGLAKAWLAWLSVAWFGVSITWPLFITGQTRIISRLTSNHPTLRPIIPAYFQSCPSSSTNPCREVQIAVEVVAVRNVEDPSVVQVLVAEASFVVPHLAAGVAVSYPENRAGTCPIWRYDPLQLFLCHTTLTSC